MIRLLASWMSGRNTRVKGLQISASKVLMPVDRRGTVNMVKE
jgi:hypothetical protein